MPWITVKCFSVLFILRKLIKPITHLHTLLEQIVWIKHFERYFYTLVESGFTSMTGKLSTRMTSASPLIWVFTANDFKTYAPISSYIYIVLCILNRKKDTMIYFYSIGYNCFNLRLSITTSRRSWWRLPPFASQYTHIFEYLSHISIIDPLVKMCFLIRS